MKNASTGIKHILLTIWITTHTHWTLRILRNYILRFSLVLNLIQILCN